MNTHSEQNIKELLKIWKRTLKQATDYDSWGQPIEATGDYTKLSQDLQAVIAYEESLFTNQQKNVLSKVATCLDLRCESLKHRRRKCGITLDDVKKVEQVLYKLDRSGGKEDVSFPVDVAELQLQTQQLMLQSSLDTDHWHQDDEDDTDEIGHLNVSGNLLPKPLAMGGRRALSVRILKIGLKDVSQYINPFITVSVKDRSCVDLTASQDTPVSASKVDDHVIFNIEVHIQKPVDILPQGFAIFFEFKHYKPKKRCISSKCWGFLEQDEIQDGDTAIELYKKPINFKRKSLHLLTTKALFLHLRLNLTS